MNDNRLRMSKYKSLIIVLLVGLTSKVSAASILQSEIGSGFGVLETLNRFLLFPLTTYQDLGIFIAIWAGFYYATKPILHQLMSGMLEAFPSLGDDGGRRTYNTADGVKRSVRGLSLVSGFVAAQYLGWVIGGLALIIIGSLSLVCIAAYMIWGTKGFANELRGNGEDSVSDGGAQTQNPPSRSGSGPDGSTGEIPDELTEDISQMSDAISNLDKRIDEIESEDRTVMDELRQLKSEVEDLDDFLQRIPEMVSQGKLTEKQAEEVKRLIEDAENLEQLEEDIEKNNEKLLQMEEKVESNEKNIAELETLIAEIEEKAEEDLVNTRQKLNNIRTQNQEVKNELSQLEEQLDDDVIDRETYEQEKAKLQEQFETLGEELQSVQKRLQQAANEREQIKARIATLENQMSGAVNMVGDLEGRIEELEKEESQGEQMEQKDEQDASSVAGDLPDEVKGAIVGDMKDEKGVLGHEENETSDLEELLDGEEGSLHVEKNTAEDEKALSEKIDQDFIKLAQAAEQLEKEYKEETQEFRIVDQKEKEEFELEQESIRDIMSQLSDLSRDQTSMSDQRKEQYAEKALKRVEELEENTQDAQQLEMLERSREYARQILQKEEQRIQDEAQTGQEAEKLALEAQEFAGALPSGEEQNAIALAEESFDDAGQVWLNPNRQKSIDQTQGWIWKQQEVLEKLERIKQNHQGDQQRVQEAERLEEGLVHIINRICKERGIDRSQFTFLP